MREIVELFICLVLTFIAGFLIGTAYSTKVLTQECKCVIEYADYNNEGFM